MGALLKKKPPGSHPATAATTSDRSCTGCMAYEANLCAAASRKLQTAGGGESGPLPLGVIAQTVPARRTICHPNEQSEFVPIICEGWAAISTALPGGRRQILSFLLPGDIVSTAWLVGSLTRLRT